MKRSEDQQRGRQIQKDLSSFRVLEPLISDIPSSKSSVPSSDLNAVKKMQLEAVISINSATRNLSILAENYLERAEGRIEETDRTKFYTLSANLFAKSGWLKKIESLLLAYSDNYSRSCTVFNDSNMFFFACNFSF